MIMNTKLSCRKATPLIWERAAGDLSHEQAAALDAHLEQCVRCREESRRAERAFQLLAAADQPVEPRADGWDRLYRRITAPVVPLWRRLTAPALTSAAVTAATLLVAISQFTNVSPGPRGVVVVEDRSQPVPQPNVTITSRDGTFAVTSLPGDTPAWALPVIVPAPAETDIAKPKRIASRIPKQIPPPVAAREAGPVVLHATWNADFAPPKPVIRLPERVVELDLDPYTGDYIGRPVNGTGA